MEGRLHSVVVLGATGFTGRRVLKELLASSSSEHTFAAAGRSQAGLQAMVQEAGIAGRCAILANVDVTNYDSLLHMAQRTRIVINCVGPYRLYGEPVVRACVSAGTHYLDICGEPEFIERMEHEYGASAKAAGCLVASACGFDSMPADLGVIYAQRQFQPPAVPSSVECYMTISPGPEGYSIHYATWYSAVLGFASVANLRALRAKVKAAGEGPPAAKPAGPRPASAAGLAFCNAPAVNAWHLPFPGADASVVRRTQAALALAGELPVHFIARFTMPTWFYASVAAAVGGVMTLMASTEFGRSLLLSKPGLFSYGLVNHEGPTETQIANTTSCVTLVARGYAQGPPSTPDQTPDKEVVVKLTAADPGYQATSVFVANAALTVLEEQDRLPGPGVWTGGALLRNTTYLERLQKRGVKLEVL